MTIRVPVDRIRGAMFEQKQILSDVLRAEIPALLGDPSSEALYVDANTQTHVYVHDDGNTISGVTTMSAAGIPKSKLKYKQPILIKLSPSGTYRFVGIDDQADAIYSAGDTETTTGDPVYVEQIRHGTLHPYSGLQVLVVGADYGDDHVVDKITDAFDGTAQDTAMASISVPTTNNRQKAVLIQMDASTGTLEYKQGSEYSAAINRENAESSGKLPTKDAGRFRVGHVFLKAGTSTLTYDHLWSRPEWITSGGGTSLPVDDTTSLVQDPSDNTKQIRMDAGNIATSTVRTLTMPDADVVLHKNNLTATSAPTVNNDIDEGYTPGSVWLNVTLDNAYLCIDNTDGAAVWLPIGGTATIIGHTIESSMDSTADYMAFYDIGAGALKAILGQNLPGNIAQELLGTYRVPTAIDTTSATYVDIDATNIAQSVTLSGSERIEAQFFISKQQQVTGGTGSYKLVADSTDPDSLVEYTTTQTSASAGPMMFATWSGLGAGTYVIKPQFKTSANTTRVNMTAIISWRVVVIQ